MRILMPLLLLTAATVAFTTPTASACHVSPDPWVILDAIKSPGYYVVPDVDYGGCPHRLTLCLEIWKETNGQPGLQDSDQLVVLVCPYP